MRDIDRLAKLTEQGDLEAARSLHRLAARTGADGARVLAGRALVDRGAWTLDAAARTSIGLHRAVNDDAYTLAPALGRFLVADGIGSHFGRDEETGGNVASRLLASSFAQEQTRIGGFDVAALWRPGIAGPGRSEEEVLSLLERVHRAYRASAAARPGLGAAVATFALAAFLERQVLIAHVGDVRVYRLREERLQRLTEDHTLASQLIRQGRLDPEDAEQYAYPEMLLRAFGANADELVVDLQRSDIVYDDLYLLCSDGLHRQVDEDFVADLLRRAGIPLARCCGALIDEANQRGGRDNATAILVRVGVRD